MVVTPAWYPAETERCVERSGPGPQGHGRAVSAEAARRAAASWDYGTMRITGVESTDLFTGSTARPLQVVRVGVEATEAGEAGAAASVRVVGGSVETTAPFGMTLGAPGEGRTGEVSVAVTGAPGLSLPVTVICETSGARVTSDATITVAEPGWTMWMVSHFHYDPVWWNTQGQFTEARLVLPDEDGKLPDVRTAFELVRLHLEKARRDADYKFVLAELDYLKPHFDAFPADRAYLRSLLADGRVELVGGTYNEPNTNLTGAEATIRNAVYGMGFQRGVLGAEVGSAWMLDAFGFDPGFPSLMAGAGLTSSSWARGPFHQWGPEENTRMQFPAEFEWLSPDGSGLLTAYMANHYGAGWVLNTANDLDAALAAAYSQFKSLASVAATPNVMLPVGSDHVIPARWVTDVGREWAARYVWPRFVPAVPREFFSAVRAAAEATPAKYWIMPQTRDMNPLYTGKDVSYADTKLAHRAGETALLEGERLATLAWLGGAPYPAESLDKAWRQLAYGAHHDAITGTESDQVYLDLLAGWREAWQRGDAARQDAIAFLTGSGADSGSGPAAGLSVTVANGLARTRDGLATATVRLESPGSVWLTVLDPVSAEPLPALAEGTQWHDDGSLAEVTLTFRATDVPALGFKRYPLRTVPMPDETEAPTAGSGGAAAAEPARVCDWFDVDGLTISNDAFGVTADPARGGTITILDKRAGSDGWPVLSDQGNDLVLQEEYEQHPRWGEGPWHLSPKGPGVGSVSVAATVQAQRSPVGSRLVATYSLGDLSVTAETILWDGAERVEFRTHVSGSIGKDRLLRVRFPAEVHGGLPVYQTATAVVGRPFGTPEVDVAEHWWTLDNPAHHWFGIGSVAQIALTAPSSEKSTSVWQAIGVAEVVTPNALPADQRGAVKDLVVALAGAGVTATTSRAPGARYGSIDLDSNLPDFRIALGGPEENSFTAEVLAAADPAAAKRLAALAADGGAARLWVPAARSRAEAFGPDADLRGPRDLPVLIVAPSDPAELAQAIAELCAGLRDGTMIGVIELAPDAAPDAAEPDRFHWPHDLLGQGAVALFNRGTLGCVVTPDGNLWMSLFRACGGWPSGVWIDGDRQAAPDGSSFAWQHWSHTFRYALASTRALGGWREAGFSAAAEEFNHDLVATTAGVSATATPPAVTPPTATPPTATPGAMTPGAAFWIAGAPNVTLSALKPVGNPLAAGRPGTPPTERRAVTVRLRETDGRPATAQLGMAGGIAAAWRTDLLEESQGAPLTIADGIASVGLAPFETATLIVAPSANAGAAGTGTTDAAAAGTGASTALPEPVQPMYARYWLHGKGPAPAGNVPVAVHFTPTRITLNGDAPAGATTLTVACGPEPASGTLDLMVVGELIAEVDGTPVPGSAEGSSLRYDLPANGFASWDIAVQAAKGTADGRYFIAARISDALGQALEDTLLVTVGEAGPPDASLEPEELFFRMQSDVQALAGEAAIEVLTPTLRLTPGESGELTVKVTSRLGSQLRGEVQLISPIGTWQTTTPWTQAVEVAPGDDATVSFSVTVPATAEPGWQSWLLVKLMYFGRVRYSPAINLTVA
jgi:alpha-mannosidase